MFIRKPVAYALLVAVLLIATLSGAYTANAQTQNPPAPPAEAPAENTQPFQPDQMMGAMAGMLEQIEALLTATDHPAHQQMAPALIKILEGMQELNQPVTTQIHGQTGPGHEAQLQRMAENGARMQAMTERIHGMAGHGAAPAAPADPSAESHKASPEGPPASQMQMGQSMQMMGMMMQMMGMMQSQMAGEMMGDGMMEGKGAMGGEMQMAPMMGMMGQMMEKMGQMQGMMGDGMMGKGMMGKGMMDGGGMGQMGAGAPVTGTVTADSPAAAPAGGAEQSVEGGGVTVKVTPLTLTDGDAATLDFAASLDTHTVELNYDLAQLVTLTDNLGNTYTPAAWTPEKGDGHHVGGLLSFADRATILQEGVTELTMNVTEIAGVASREFVWVVAQ